MIDQGEGDPDFAGTYVAETAIGWKVFTWDRQAWWFPDGHARWLGGRIAQWVGPLPPAQLPPVRLMQRPPAKKAAPAPVEFDL